MIVNRFDCGEWSKIDLGKLCVWAISLKFLFLFSFFLCFNLSVCFNFLLLYVLLCLYSLGLCSCYVLKHVRIFDLSFWSLALFPVFLEFLRWIPRAHNLASHVGMITYMQACSCVRMILPRNPNLSFFLFCFLFHM